MEETGRLVALVAGGAGVLALLALVVAFVFHRSWRSQRRWLRAAADEVRIAASSNPSHRLAEGQGTEEQRVLAAAINALAARHSALAADVESREARARAGAEAERERLAAIVSQLSQGVIVCRSDGEILLYNDSARRLLETTGVAGAPRLALGRSLHGWIDRPLIDHALSMLGQRAAREGPVAQASFVTTTRGGTLLRVRVVALEAGLALTLDDVTAPIETARRVDALVTAMSAEGRSALGNLRTAIETLREFPDLDASHQSTLVDIVVEEAGRLGDRLQSTETEYATLVTSQWSFEDILLDDLLMAAGGRIRSRLDLACAVDAAAGETWVRVDSFAIVQALSALASRVKMHCAATGFELASVLDGGRFVGIDLCWQGAPLDADTWRGWESQSLRLGGEANPLSLKAVLTRHAGEAWLGGDDRNGARSVRLMLPRHEARPVAAEAPAAGGTHYDLARLGSEPGSSDATNDRALDTVAFTVIDPAVAGTGASTRIGRIAAARIVGGRIDGQGLELAPAGEEGELHGETALPPLHAFSRDTVLVAESPSTLLTWLRANQSRTGTRFDGPALDLARLFAAAYPGLGTMPWSEIARRIGVSGAAARGSAASVQAMADALLRLQPELAARGIATLADALRVAGVGGDRTTR